MILVARWKKGFTLKLRISMTGTTQFRGKHLCKHSQQSVVWFSSIVAQKMLISSKQDSSFGVLNSSWRDFTQLHCPLKGPVNVQSFLLKRAVLYSALLWTRWAKLITSWCVPHFRERRGKNLVPVVWGRQYQTVWRIHCHLWLMEHLIALMYALTSEEARIGMYLMGSAMC